MQNTGSTAKNEKHDNPSMSQVASGASTGAAAAQGTDTLAQKASSALSHMKDGFSDFTSQAQEKVTDVAHKAQEYGEKAVGETRTFVRNNPGQALLIGFGAGLILGYAVARK